jgi:hypothetical protein
MSNQIPHTRHPQVVFSAKFCIFGYILIRELISQGLLTDECVKEDYQKIKSVNLGNQEEKAEFYKSHLSFPHHRPNPDPLANSVLDLVIQGIQTDIIEMKEGESIMYNHEGVIGEMDELELELELD